MTRYILRLPTYLRRCRVHLLLAAGLLGIVAPVEASPIRHRQPISSETARDYRSWVTYLSAGPTVWAHLHDPPINQGIRAMMIQALRQSDPLTNPFTQFLLWRRNLNPIRFDRWHPVLGPLLQNLPPPQTSTSTPPPPNLAPQTIPEPRTWLMSVMLIGTGVWWRRRVTPALPKALG
ncbi:hypothetical protein ACYOEI_14150 [Singulisphaera rosea]